MTYYQCYRSTLALTRKNYTIRKRQIVSSLLDILIPLGFIILMLFLKGLFTTQTFPGREYSAPPDHTTVPPFLTIPSGLHLAGSGGIIVVTSLPGSPGGAAAAQRFFASATALYPSVNLGTLGGGVLVAAEVRALGKDTLSTLNFPGFKDVAVLMPDEGALQSYCTANDYGTIAKPPVYASIVFSSDTPNLDYSLRFNSSALPNPYPFVFTYSPKYMGSSKYVAFSAPKSNQYGAASATSSLNNATFPGVKIPGFLTLQLAVDRFAINRPLEASSPSLPALTTSLVTKFCEGIVALVAPTSLLAGQDLGAACLNLTTGETATLASALAAGPMAAELLAPQSIDLAPFPTRQYTQNIFYDGVLGALTLLFILAFMYPIGRLIAFLVNEKETKLRESLLAMGLSEVALVSSWFLTQTVIYTILCLGITLVGLRLFPSSSPVIVFLLFWSFTLSTISLSMVIAVPFKSSNTASILGNTLYLLLYFTFYNIKDTSPVTLRTAIALLSPAAFAQGLQTMAGLETGGIGATLTTASTVSINNWTVGASIAMQLWDTVLYLLLAYYLDRTLPSALRDFGTPLPPWFPCLPSFWGCKCGRGSRKGGRGGLDTDAQEKLLGSSSSSSSSSSSPTSLGPHFQGASAEDRAKEEAGRCLSLVGLRKEFSTPDGVKVATDVDHLNLYEGQISCLLGHNGAGKTTLISMLTGLIPPTSGSATVFGKDLGGDLGSIRKDLGVCPQHDVLWPDMTVFEHLQLFGVIKGVQEERIEEEGVKALAQVGLTEKRHALVSSLSGGMKRKLSVCLAFLGGSKVVLLDEPTSGMDPYSRRSTWQILQNAREGRVILLTTHFMDEAEILGDRIAIMDAGKVACSGTPAFLKDSYSLGYTLTVVCAKGEAGGASSDALTTITLAHVPGAKRVSSAGNEVKFRLSASSATSFPALLAALESQPSVESLGMHVSSIEDIFMRIASHTPEQEGGEEGVGVGVGGKEGGKKETQLLVAASEKSFSSYGTSSSTASSSINALGGNGGGVKSVRDMARKELQPWEAFTIHTGAILVKRSRYARRDYCAVCCLLLVPVILLSLGLWLIQSGFQTTTLDFQLSTSQFNSPNFFASGGSGPTLIPAFTFTSSTSNNSTPPPTNPNVTGFLGHFQVENATQGGAVLDGATAQQLDARNPYGFITSTTQPNRDLQRMSTYLLDDSRKHAASTFGALIFPGEETLTPPSGGGVGGMHTLGILYNSTAVHSAPILLNLANTAALRYTNGSFPPGAPSSTPGLPSIATHSHALPYTAWELSALLFAQTLAVVQVLLIATSFITPSFSLFIVREREVSAKHQQLISGVSIPAYWLANWAWDVFTYLLPAACCLIVLKAFGANAVLSTAGNRLPALLALFFAYGCSGAAYTHALTHAFSSPFVAGGVALFLNIIQLAGVIACAVLGLFSNTCKAVPPTIATASLLPFFAFGTGLNRIFSLDTLGGPASAPFLCQVSNGGSPKPSDFPPVTSAFAPAAAGTPLLYLALTTPLYFAISIALDYARSDMALRSWLGLQFTKWMVALRLSPASEGGGESIAVRAVDEEGEDEDVVREAQQAQEEGELVAAQGWQQGVGAVGRVEREEEKEEDGSREGGVSTIILSHLRKFYAKGKKTAVRDLSFRVEQGEVFGFLGINGAGKTTTLRMLTGDELPSSGKAWLAGYDIIKEQGQVRRLLGYCPQFDALLDLLTPREHLELYARIKGVPLPQLKGVVDSKLAEFDLLPFQNKITKSLSGGNKRKLSVAIALIGDPPVIFLDEPSTGVDPVAKRFMWRVINTIATERKSCSLILTTHSMEEVEALCSRIGIMVGGRLRCMGSAQHLRNRHGGGFTLDVLLPPPTPQDVEGVVGTLTGKGGPAVDRGGEVGWVLESSAIPLAASALGVEARAGEVREDGLGWVVYSAMSQRGGFLPVEDFARWWCEMNESEAAIAGATSVFPGAVLTERQTRALKFFLASATLSQGQKLSALFASVEVLRGKLPTGAIVNMGQYTLESVFNMFAAQQEEESTLAPGFIKS